MLVEPSLRARIDHTAAQVEVEVARHLGLPVARHGPGWSIAHGPGRYINRTMGIGSTPVLAVELDAMESFYASAGLPAALELSSGASPDLVALLAERGYGPRWFRSVYLREIEASSVQSRPEVRMTPVTDEHLDAWHAVRVTGFSIATAAEQTWDRRFAEASRASGSLDFLAFCGDQAAGCGGLRIMESLAWLGAAATVPSHRPRYSTG